MISKEQWLEVGALELEEDQFGIIDIGAMEVETLLPEAKERIIQKAELDPKYREIRSKVQSEEHEDRHFSMDSNMLGGMNRIYVPEKLRERIIQSENDSKVAGHFGRERTLELVSRNFYWLWMERDVR